MTEPTPETMSGEQSAAPATVFFSYSRVDQAQALPIIKAIEAAGYHVWWDGMLEGGTEFLDQTEAALESAKAVVVLWSRKSVGSHWVRDEATSGRERERLIPLTLDGTMPPLGFRQLQVIDMRKWYKRPEVQDELMRGLAKLHDREYQPLDPAHRFGDNARAKTGLSRRTLLLGCGVGAAAVLALGLPRLQRTPRALGRTIAVLPFVNQVADPALAYVAGGLAASVRDGLSMNALLDVTARSSSQKAARESADTKQVAKLLNVDHVLEGRFESLQNRSQFVVSLVNGQNGFVQWTKSYPYRDNQILVVRDAILQAVVEAMPETTSEPEEGMTKNPEAFNEYIQGNELLMRSGSSDTVERVTQRYRRAIELDPLFGLAHSALAELLLNLGATSSDKAKSLALIEESVRTAQRGVEIAPNVASTHITYGFILLSGRADIKGAEEAFNKAEDLGLRQSFDMQRFAVYLAGVGRADEAITMARRAQARDPLNPSSLETVAFAYYSAGQFERAVAQYNDVLSADPSRHTVRAWLGLSKIYAGDPVAGLKACADETNLMEKFTCQAIAQSRLGDPDQAQDRFAALVDEFGDAAAYQQAQIQAQMDMTDEAMETLLKAEALQDTGLSLAGFDPALDPLRTRDDFKALLGRMGHRNP